MGKLVISEWVSLDGVFDAETMPQWFEPYDSPSRSEYIKGNVDAAGAFLMGRTTYEMLGDYWPKQQHNEFGIAERLNRLRKYVVSKTLTTTDWTPAHIIKGDVARAVDEVKRSVDGELLLFGSATLVRSLAPTDLIDEYRILVHPVIAGIGKRFYREDMPLVRLSRLEERPLDKGVLLLRYGRA